MKAGLFFKILGLMVALVIVVMAIRGLNQKNVENAMSALGIESGAGRGLHPAGRALQPGEEHFNLCRTRIVSIQWPTGQRVEEFKAGLKLKWLAVDPSPREISYLEMEKWLSVHCQVIIAPTPEAPTAGEGQEFSIKYVDGSVLKFRLFAPDRFDLSAFGEKRPLRSEDLRAALAELKEIAQLRVPGAATSPTPAP